MPNQRLRAPHPEDMGVVVQVLYVGAGKDHVDVISHHPYTEQRRHQVWVRYADSDPHYKDRTYLVDRDGVEPIID